MTQPRKPRKNQKQQQVTATPLSELSELERQIQDKPENYLQCRELRHQWNGYTAWYSRTNKNIIERTLRCQRCGAQKDQEISARNGTLLWSGALRYPEGYLFTGVGRITSEAMGVVRLASVTNQLFEVIQPKNQEKE